MLKYPRWRVWSRLYSSCCALTQFGYWQTTCSVGPTILDPESCRIFASLAQSTFSWERKWFCLWEYLDLFFLIYLFSSEPELNLSALCYCRNVEDFHKKHLNPFVKGSLIEYNIFFTCITWLWPGSAKYCLYKNHTLIYSNHI